MNPRMIDANYLIAEFTDRARAARNWKESALNSGNEEAAIRADATLAFLIEVKLTIDNAPTLPNPCGNPCNFTRPTDDTYRHVAVKMPNGDEWDAIYDVKRHLLYSGYITKELALKLGWTMKEAEDD